MKKTNPKLDQFLPQLLIFIGLILALIQLLLNRSLWLDEAYLALSIVKKTPVELLQPLYYHQVAPILFLQIEKLFSTLFPNSEFGLRLFPFVSYCLSLLLFQKIVQTCFKSFSTRLFALSLFVFCGPLIYYASEVKQYMSDVLVLLAFYHFTLKNYADENDRFKTLTALGCVSIFLSNIAPIVLFTEGSYFLFLFLLNKSKIPKIFIVTCFTWLITFSIYYFLFIHNHPAQKMMHNYWSANHGFMPINPLDIKFYATLFERMRTFFSLFFGFNGGVLLPILFGFGILFLVKTKQISRFILLLLPISLHWFLSGLRLYPFDARLILYACPSIILVTTHGFERLTHTLFSKYALTKSLTFAAIMPLLMVYSFYDLKFYTKGERLKDCFDYVENVKISGAKTYVSYHASAPFQYYKTILSAPNDSLIIGRFANSTTVFDADLRQLHSKTWFFFSDWTPIDKRNAAYLLDYFAAKNIVLERHFKTVGYNVYLFDIPEEGN